jgi:hypothetical protein
MSGSLLIAVTLNPRISIPLSPSLSSTDNNPPPLYHTLQALRGVRVTRKDLNSQHQATVAEAAEVARG